MNSMVCVEVGDKRKYTKKRENTDCPYFSEVLQCESILQSNKVLGSITLDIGTVYSQPDHQFFHTWALLLCPEDMFIDSKGYIKCTISVMVKGEVAKIPMSIEDEKEGIAMNTLSEGQLALYICHVYKFTGSLSANDSCKVNKFSESQKKLLKNNISKESNSNDVLDLFVELTFGNLIGETCIKKGVSSFEWNEQVTFLARFPPLFHKLLIGIKEGNSSRKNPTIAQHSLYMNEISHDGEEGFLPCFGPSYIHMYAEETFKGITIYVGKLLFSLETKLNTPTTSVASGKKGLIDIGPIQKADESKDEVQSNLLLVCCIIQASLMDKKFIGNNAHLELNFGPETTLTGGGINKNSNKTIPRKSAKDKPSPQELCDLINGQDKPCLWIQSLWPSNVTYRLHQSNIMAKIAQLLEEKLWKVSELLKKKKDSLAEEEMNYTLRCLVDHCGRGISLLEAKPKKDGTRTILDLERLHYLRKELKLMQQTALLLQKSLSPNSVNKIKDVTETFVITLYSLVEDPQDPYPDVILSLIINDRRLAQQKIKCREFMFSPDSQKCGEDYAKRRIIFLKKTDSRSGCDFPLTMAVEVYFWMGFLSEIPDNYLQGIPKGFSVVNENTDDINLLSNNLIASPTALHYHEKHAYQLLAHIFQGRFIPGSDASGLCDPYIKIIIGNNVNQTQVKFQTLHPLWDQMLIFHEMDLYGLPEDIKSNPPTIIIEAMDKDNYSKVEFIGRGLSEPCVKILNDYETVKNPTLDWIELYNTGEITGEILAAFELLEVSGEFSEITFPKDLLGKSSIFPIPSYIRPKMVPYKLEILFWGLRNFSSILMNPQVTIEVGSLVLKSSVISNVKEYPNFASPIVSAELELPENKIYCPPLIIKVWDKRTFGRLVNIGSHIVSSVSQFSNGNFNIKWPMPIVNCTSFSKGSEKMTDDEYSSETSNNMEKEPLLKTKKPNQPHLNKLSTIFKKTKDRNENKPAKPEESFDWWTKYYESLKKSKEIKNHRDRIIAKTSENDYLITTKNYEDNPISIEYEELSPIFEDIECSKPKYKKSGRMTAVPTKRKSRKTEMKKKSRCVSQKQNDMVKPASFVIFSNELEKQPEFHRFQDWMDCYDIYHGKRNKSEITENKVVGKFKGLIKLKNCVSNNNNFMDEEPSTDDMEQLSMNETQEEMIQINTPTNILSVAPLSNQALKILIRVYVIRAYSLTPKDFLGRADPYVIVSVGDRRSGTGIWGRFKKNLQKVSGDRSEYIEQNLNPIFGRCYELEAILPRDNLLTIWLMDWDMGGHDDIIGITEIDIENRIYSKHRVTCGISSSFQTSGYNKWRDPQLPSAILQDLCNHFNLGAPVYKGNEVTVGQTSFSLEEKSKPKRIEQKRESLALAALKRWSEIIGPEGFTGWNLVPEHVETRSLYDSKKKGIEQGKLEMWVDLFYIPKEIENKDAIQKFIGLPVDISPRKPKPYELRVIIWNTSDVELCDTNIIYGEKSSDIFVKGWLYGPNVDCQCTDVHYHSLSGEANFNWRFIFPFLYLAPEKSLVVPDDDKKSAGKKAIKFMKSLLNLPGSFEIGEHIPCRLILQVWDEDQFTSNDFIGSVTLDINNIPLGSKTAKKCNPDLLRKGSPRIDLFKIHRIRGWWPVVTRKMDSTKNKKENSKMTGKIEAELQLLTKDEADVMPAGKGREEPCALPEPKRPDTTLTWLRNPLKILKFAVWKNYRKSLLKWTILFLISSFILLGLYSLPGYIIKRLVGA